MPIFRILGGGNSSSSNSSSRSFLGGRSSNSSSNNPCPYSSTSSNNNNNATNSNQRTSNYPGLRVQRNSNNDGGIGIGVGSNRSRGLFSSINGDSFTQSSPSHNNSPYVAPPLHIRSPVVVRGSNVPATSPPSGGNPIISAPRGPSMPAPPGRISGNSRSTSVGSTTFPTPTTPYVDSPRSTRRNITRLTSNSVTATDSTTSSSTSRPGSYSVTRSNVTGSSQVYRVTVPQGVAPGNEFTVHAGNRRVRVRCPTTSRPGHSLQITLPPEPVTTNTRLTPARLTRACEMNNDPSDTADSVDVFMRHDSAIGSGGADDMSLEVQEVNRKAASGGGTPKTFLVTIPPNIHPGMTFNVSAEGQKFKVTCPPNAGPNSKVRIVAPAAGPRQEALQEHEPHAAPKMQVYEVIVPQGVRPNQPFTLMANNQRVLVTCPPNVSPGQKIRFQLPVHTTKTNKMNVQLSYKDDSGSSGWERTIRVTDMKFQWIRVTEKKDDDDIKKLKSDDPFSVDSPKNSSTRLVEDMKISTLARLPMCARSNI